MMASDVETRGLRLQFRLGGSDRVIAISEARLAEVRALVRTVAYEPFTRRTWNELFYFSVSVLLTALGLVFISYTMATGVVLAVTFIGLVIIAGSLRGARGIGTWHRALARRLIGEDIEEPQPFAPRPGFFGWLQTALRDPAAWRSVVYCVVKVPLSVFGVWFAFSFWVDAFFCLSRPLWGPGVVAPPEFGFVVNVFPPGYLSVGSNGFFHDLFIFFSGVILVFAAPWAVRAAIYLDRRLMRVLLAPGPLSARVRSLEQARAQTVDTSAATLRRIERDLHDGTQAQLVAVAMRLGQVKEKLATDSGFDLDQVRKLVDDAHSGAKEAIVELRDLARGIHPPALDIGLEGALSTLAARSTVPADLTVAMVDRPTQAIEAIAYFCVAELMANVVQHAHASRVSISCAQHGSWLRIVVRDDGQGGAQVAVVGSSSSGLSGLTDRVHAVDGRFYITSPPAGPTIVTVDLPLHA
jgi:signal transduction histidine kinase